MSSAWADRASQAAHGNITGFQSALRTGEKWYLKSGKVHGKYKGTFGVGCKEAQATSQTLHFSTHFALS